MDNEVIKFLTKSKNVMAFAILAVFILAAVQGITKFLVPKYQDWVSLKSEIATKKEQYENLKSQKEKKDLEEKKSHTKIDKVPVQIYRSATPGLPVDSASIDFVTSILSMLENTGNTVTDISYKIDILSDAEKKSIPAGVSVVQLVMSLNGTYTSYMDFISSLYDYDYLATIKSMKLTPLKENKNVLEIKMVLWLYVSK